MNGADVLRCWEKGRSLPAFVGALWYLQCHDPRLSWEHLQQLPIGERDRRLLALRARLFGPVMHVFTECPHCRLELEYRFDSEPMLAGVKDNMTLTFDMDGAQVRLINTADQLSFSRMTEEQARQFIMTHCIEVQNDRGLPPLDQVMAAILQQDPLAEIVLQLRCEQCGHAWPQLLDVAGFFQKELDHHARSLLQQVHVLARAYGWSEQEILHLSTERRLAYLEMVMA